MLTENVKNKMSKCQKSEVSKTLPTLVSDPIYDEVPVLNSYQVQPNSSSDENMNRRHYS